MFIKIVPNRESFSPRNTKIDRLAMMARSADRGETSAIVEQEQDTIENDIIEENR